MQPRRPAAARIRTLADLIRHGARRFAAARLAFGHGTTNAYDEAAYLALHAAGLPPDAPDRVLQRKVRPGEAARALALFKRRIGERQPAAYLTREAWLADRRFYVDERVIVPRSHIAELLRERLTSWALAAGTIGRALDLCTGSGCLAILLAQAFPRARVDAADISTGALAVARINVGRHRLSRRIRLIRSDLFSALGRKNYDLIVSNPPYVTSAGMRRLPGEYRHEPRLALAGGRDGLKVVRAILKQAHAHLNPGGLLVVEVGGGKRRLERAYPRTPFLWPATSAGETVFILSREELPR